MKDLLTASTEGAYLSAYEAMKGFMSSVKRQKIESQNGDTFLTPWYAHVRVRIRG